MLIDLTGTVKFGNITGGGGLAAAFDDTTSTVAYTEYTAGYVGVTLTSPRRIDKMEVYSASNGFDASGLTTPITLHLYGKVGSVPTSGTDGVLIASANFTDQNITRLVTLESLDKSTPYDHVWLRMYTGVWCVVSSIKFFEAEDSEPVPEPSPLAAGSHVLMSSCNESVLLTQAGAEIPQFRILFSLDSPRKVLLDFHGDVVHIGAPHTPEAGYPVGYSFHLCRRSAATLLELQPVSFTAITNAVGGGNVSERNPQHYGNKSICSYLDLPAGLHEISVIGSGHTDATTAQLLKVLSEYGQGLNCLRVTVLP